MDFVISHTHIAPGYLVAIGFVVGLLGGFFGVGGSFLAGPSLYALGLPMNFVVGTDLAHIVGKSIVAAKRHRALGNVDLKLGLLMTFGTITGVETGAQIIQMLKRTASVDWPVGIAFVGVLVGISLFMAYETWKTFQSRRQRPKSRLGEEEGDREDHSALDHISKKIQGFRFGPYVSLPVSGIERISIWAILLVAFWGGFFSGFLGGGAGYIRMPSLVYLLGIPTHIAVGTDLFEIVISAGYGTFTHALKGNVDIFIALVMHTGAAIGAHFGAGATQFFYGPKIRVAFIPLPLIGAIFVLHGLWTGPHLK